jgi:glycosyltransferase involved in cell wall biosynthesis
MTPTGEARLRIAQVVYTLKQGGSERVACNLATHFDRRRIEPVIYTLDGRGPLAEELRQAGIPTADLGRRPGFDWRLIGRLVRRFRRDRIHVVQPHHHTQLVYSALAARLAGCALVHVEHEYFSMQSAKARRRFRLLAPLCHRVVAVGDAVGAFLRDTFALTSAQLIVIGNGIDTDRYSPPPAATGVASERVPVIGHVARLEPEKDQDTLLRAFRRVRAKRPARLVIVGDGSRRPHLEALARDLELEDVEFLGARHDVAELLRGIDVFVLSSINEGLPLSVLEAQACGRPVVATAVGDIPSVVKDGVTGFTVPTGDADALAQQLLRVLDAPDEAASLGAAARRLVESRFSLAAMVGRYEDLYDAVMLERHRRRAGRPR